MKRDEITSIVDDRMSQRFESLAQTLNALHQDYHVKMLDAVEKQIKIVVNGKIDKIQTSLEKQDTILASLDSRIKPFEDTKHWFQDAKKGAGWIAGFLTSITLIIGALMYIVKKIIIFK